MQVVGNIPVYLGQWGCSSLTRKFTESIFVMATMLVFEIRTCLCIYHSGHFYNRNTKEIEAFTNTMIYLVH